ncbi:hypothetical protein [Kiloniella litopenaei]|uniref:capsular polysaccharide export protein, LipB/KpsS family n=1 Tax=Kiloniella litopenaei TaxID=1549748 RepID=UPI003BAB5830
MFRQSKIFMIHSGAFSSLMGRFARTLKQEHGIETVLFVNDFKLSMTGMEKRDFHESDFVEIIDLKKTLIPRPKSSFLDDDFHKRVQTIEKRLGVPLTEIVRSDRHLGKSFVTGAEYMRSHYGISTDYDQSIDIAERLITELSAKVDEHKPIALISIIGNIVSTAAIDVCKASNIPLMAPVLSRAGNALCWAKDKAYTPYDLEESYNQRHGAQDIVSGNSAEAPAVSELERNDRVKKALANAQRNASYKHVLRIWYKALRRKAGDIYHKRQYSYGNYLLSDRLKEAWLLRKAWAKELSNPVVMKSLDRPYVFFPLHVEPESSLMAESAMTDNQLTCLDWLAKTIPSNWRIIVKEHPGFTARRPEGFWERVQRYPNIMKANILESGEELAKRAHVIATINSTVGFQAAVEGNPVLSFHPHFHGHFLPHVKIARSYEETRSAFMDLDFTKGKPNPAFISSGTAFQEALKSLGTPIEDEGLIMGKALPKPVEWEETKAIAAYFIKLLSQTRTASAGK